VRLNTGGEARRHFKSIKLDKSENSGESVRMLAEDPTTNQTMCSLEDFITNKWKVAYGDMSGECSAENEESEVLSPREVAATVISPREAAATVFNPREAAATVLSPREAAKTVLGHTKDATTVLSLKKIAANESKSEKDSKSNLSKDAATSSNTRGASTTGCNPREGTPAIDSADGDDCSSDSDDGSLSPISNDDSNDSSSCPAYSSGSERSQSDSETERTGFEIEPERTGLEIEPERTGLEIEAERTGFEEYSNNNLVDPNRNSLCEKESQSMQLEKVMQSMDYELDRKSRSVPPLPSPTMDCLDCPAVDVPWRNPCACPRKRKEPQDEYYEHERKWSRSSSLKMAREAPRILANISSLKNQQGARAPMSPAVILGPKSPEILAAEPQIHLQKVDVDDVETRLKPRRRRRSKRRSSSSNQSRSKHSSGEDSNWNRFGHEENSNRNGLSYENAVMDNVATHATSHKWLNLSHSAPVRETPEVSGCWVSEQLAHILGSTPPKPEESKQITLVENVRNKPLETPRLLPFMDSSPDSNRFTEMNIQRGTAVAGSKVDRSRAKVISRQLSDLKKELELLEIRFREEFGYRPSKQDKLNSPQISAVIAEQTRLKREMKQEKELAAFPLTSPTQTKPPTDQTKSLEAIRKRLAEITRKMATNRTYKKRPIDFQTMSLDQILEEKLELQSLLKDYEREFGHPETREERDATKEVYERYRAIKRLARRSSQIQSGEITDMPAIPEDMVVEMTLATPDTRVTFHLPTRHSTGENVSKHDMDLPSFLDRLENDNVPDPTRYWHTLSRLELVDISARVREEKKIARHAIKEFEKRFKNITGRKVTKEDREPLEQTYRVYKTSKAKLKLVSALLSKQTRHV